MSDVLKFYPGPRVTGCFILSAITVVGFDRPARAAARRCTLVPTLRPVIILSQRHNSTRICSNCALHPGTVVLWKHALGGQHFPSKRPLLIRGTADK